MSEKVTYDLEGLKECMKDYIRIQQTEKIKKIAEAEAYYMGYKDALVEFRDILNASNYRVEEEEK